MKKIFRSSALVLVVAAIAGYATYSFFSDTETSTGNSFTAGAIDLKVDSQASYNGQAYSAGTWGQADNGVDITNEKFFSFTDLKPEDEGENTISLHIDNNDAWLCAQIKVTSDEDVTCTDPENEAEEVGNCVPSTTNAFNGEIAENLSLAWWADDGNNVLDTGEVDTLFFQSGLSLSDLLAAGGADNKVLNLTLADSLQNFFTDQPNDPLDGSKDYFVGLQWCFGEMDINGTTITCDGESVGNQAQTDSLTADLSFSAYQHRNNENFRCEDTYKPAVEKRNISLENKDSSWQIITGDNINGNIQYSSNDSTFHGVVTGTGLAVNGKYQITLNGPGSCTSTDAGLAGVGPNAFSSGYWNSGTGLEPTCGSPGEGVFNMDLIGDHYTFIADGSGAFTHNFSFSLPAGNYSGVKVLVKKMLETHVSPWADTGSGYPAFNLYETAPISFTVL